MGMAELFTDEPKYRLLNGKQPCHFIGGDHKPQIALSLFSWLLFALRGAFQPPVWVMGWGLGLSISR